MYYFGHTYTKTLVTVYLKFTFHWVSCISSGNPPPVSGGIRSLCYSPRATARSPPLMCGLSWTFLQRVTACSTAAGCSNLTASTVPGWD